MIEDFVNFTSSSLKSFTIMTRSSIYLQGLTQLFEIWQLLL